MSRISISGLGQEIFRQLVRFGSLACLERRWAACHSFRDVGHQLIFSGLCSLGHGYGHGHGLALGHGVRLLGSGDLLVDIQNDIGIRRESLGAFVIFLVFVNVLVSTDHGYVGEVALVLVFFEILLVLMVVVFDQRNVRKFVLFDGLRLVKLLRLRDFLDLRSRLLGCSLLFRNFDLLTPNS